MSLLEKEISNEDERELGPLKYLAETTGKDMGQVVNWFLLLIIFVFDPLAIALVVAANMAFAQIKKPEDPEENYFERRNDHLNRVVMSAPEGKKFNELYPMSTLSEPNKSLIKRVKENQKKLKKEIKIEPQDIVVDDLEKLEQTIVKKYDVYGEKYTIDELSILGKKLPRWKTGIQFNDYLASGNIKSAIKILKKYKII